MPQRSIQRRDRNPNILYSLVFALIIIISIVVYTLINRNENDGEEKYGSVLGQLADYQLELNECLNRCTRSDPSDRFLPMGNLYCDMYCNTTITEKANRGIPPKKSIASNNIVKCRKQCDVSGATPEEKRKCLSMCYGHNEVADWCKSLWCPYSLHDNDKCMKRCTSTWNANNNQVSWKWGKSN